MESGLRYAQWRQVECSGHRRIQKRTRRLLRPGGNQRKVHLGAIFDLEDQSRYGAIGTGIFRRWRTNLGGELDNNYSRVSDQTGIDWDAKTSETDPIGQHDFDFNLGIWHTQIQRIPDPLSSPAGSIEIQGTVSVRKVWGGRAQLEEIEADGPKGHWEALTLFLYDRQAHQWSQTFINSRLGVLVPPLIGSFNKGRGELVSHDTFGDRWILVRGVWSDITPNSHRYEEMYSDDGGRTWKPAFIANLTRVKNA